MISTVVLPSSSATVYKMLYSHRSMAVEDPEEPRSCIVHTLVVVMINLKTRPAREIQKKMIRLKNGGKGQMGGGQCDEEREKSTHVLEQTSAIYGNRISHDFAIVRLPQHLKSLVLRNVPHVVHANGLISFSAVL